MSFRRKVRSFVTDASSEQIAEEDRHDVGAGYLIAPATDSNSATAALDERDSSETSRHTSSLDRTEADPPATKSGILAQWQQFPSPARRLVLWAGFVLIVAFFFGAGSAVQPVLLSPQVRFENFADAVKQRLPAILYGTDPFGQPLLPVEVTWKILPTGKTGGPLFAELIFEDASFSSAGQVLYTRYKIDYQWKHDHWECHNLKCDVERPQLTKLDQMDFNAVLAHESAEKNLELVKLKRAQAEALLKPTLPLGDLLRSSNLY